MILIFVLTVVPAPKSLMAHKLARSRQVHCESWKEKQSLRAELHNYMFRDACQILKTSHLQNPCKYLICCQ
jgi:hypothetical protein